MDLIRELQVQFPDIKMPTAPALVWMGTILKVDDAVLMARSPKELQLMLDVCQESAERNRMSINVYKTKVVVFLEVPAVRKVWPRYNFTPAQEILKQQLPRSPCRFPLSPLPRLFRFPMSSLRAQDYFTGIST